MAPDDASQRLIGPLAGATLVGFVPTTDLERAGDFFTTVLGLRLVEMSPFACVLDGGGATLRVTLVEQFTPAPYTVAGWVVDDIAATAAALAGAGVPLVRYDGMPQDDLGIWTTPGNDRVAWLKDPDGNVLSLTQFALDR
jgi:catechol 2,3-dioxygenase-like lactoylglutathione lyase family enzyme